MAVETEDLTLLTFQYQTRCPERTCISLHAAVSVRRTDVNTLQVITSFNSSVLRSILNFWTPHHWTVDTRDQVEKNGSLIKLSSSKKHLSKSFLCHIPMIRVLKQPFLKIYYHKNCTLLIRSPRALYPDHNVTLCIPIVTMLGEQYTLQESLICVHLYSFSYSTFAPILLCFSQLSSQELTTFCIVFVGTYLSL